MCLSLTEKIYGCFAALYHKRWDSRGGWRASVPVISVGNITVGGNGKTPFVIELVRVLNENFPELAEPNRIAVLSRGYGRKFREMCVVETDTDFLRSGDEPLLIKRAYPSSLVISYAKRVVSARIAVEKFGARVILLDDGFQHRPLARDIDLVMLDSEQPFHNGRLLPAGRLRERPSALKRATAFVSVGGGEEVAKLAAEFDKPIFRARETSPFETWQARPEEKAFLLTGIARPERVRSFLEQSEIDIVGHKQFRDHHEFSASDLYKVSEDAAKSGATVVMTTSKDRIRIPSWQGSLPIVEIPYQLTISEQKSFVSLLKTAILPDAV